MGQALASFRDLKGIGPATEARLHETGIYTWDALATAATALASLRGSGDTPREIADAVTARRNEADEDETDPGSSNGGERLEAFVLRMSLTADGGRQRCEVMHVRTMAERAWPGWQPVELAEFIREHAGIRPKPASAKESPPAEPRDKAPAVQPPRRRRDARSRQPSSDHVVVLDAGKTIGGTSRDIDIVVTNTQAAGGDFGYRATLAARGLGRGRNGEDWTRLATRTGTGASGDDLALGFTGVRPPPGVSRLQLRLEVSLPAPATRPPALALVSA